MRSIQEKMFLSGNEALARGAWEAGVGFASSYPGTPATEILESLAGYPEIISQWAVNEKVACEVAFGAAVAGKRALFSCKHVGLNVAMDPLMVSAYSGINAGFVLAVADDPGLHSSQNEQDTRQVAPYAKVPLIEPCSPQEAYDFIQTAYRISEDFDTPVLFRLTTRIAHTKETVKVGKRRPLKDRALEKNPQKYVMIPAHAYPRHILLEDKMRKLAGYSETTPLNRVILREHSLGFIVSSAAALYVREMYPQASLLILGMSYPLPLAMIRGFVKKVKKVFVVEELDHFLEEKIRAAGIAVRAKKPSFRVGELRPEHIPLIVKGKDKQEQKLPKRRPVLCPGCPHRAAFVALRALKVFVCGDIGCYTLAALPPLASLHTQLCMGASIPFLEGIQKNHSGKMVAVIGDSTFIHSGITGLISAVYNKARGVVVILDNRTTAMTGNQPNPAIGMTAQGEKTGELDLAALARACGAASVDTVNPYEIKTIETLIQRRLQEPGLSAVICRAPCRLLERLRKPSPRVNAEKCKRCGICVGIDCPALIRDEQKTIIIDSAICTGCGICVQSCPFGALEYDEKAE